MWFVMALTLRFSRWSLPDHVSHSSPRVPYGAEQLTALPRPSGTPSSTWGFVFSKIHQLITAAVRSWCAAFAAFGYKISGPTPGLWPRSGPHSQQHIHGHTFIQCASSEPSATSSSLSRCWGVCTSRWQNLCQKIPRQLHSTWIQWEITVLCQTPQIISFQFPHSCVCIVVWLRRTFLMPAKFRG